jgi:hypothetical protein
MHDDTPNAIEYTSVTSKLHDAFPRWKKFFKILTIFSGQWRCIAVRTLVRSALFCAVLQSQQNRQQQSHRKMFGESRINDTGNDRPVPMAETLRRIVEIGVFLSRAHVRAIYGVDFARRAVDR